MTIQRIVSGAHYGQMCLRITETAKTLWFIYASLTTLCALAYWFAGMSPFDAISHSFSTVSIGGFSTHDNSMAYFNSSAVNLERIKRPQESGKGFAGARGGDNKRVFALADTLPGAFLRGGRSAKSVYSDRKSVV